MFFPNVSLSLCTAILAGTKPHSVQGKFMEEHVACMFESCCGTSRFDGQRSTRFAMRLAMTRRQAGALHCKALGRGILQKESVVC